MIEFSVNLQALVILGSVWYGGSHWAQSAGAGGG